MTTFYGGGMGTPFLFNHLLFGAFLLITTLAGTWKIKVRNFEEYVVGNGRFGVGALTLTFLATFIGGGMLFIFPQDAYQAGIATLPVWIVCMIFLNFLILIYFVAPRIVQFQHCATMGDLMYLFYGENVRILTGGLSFYFCVWGVIFQFVWLRRLYEYMGYNTHLGLVAGVVLLATYTARGGMRSIIVTDILHFVFACAVIPLLAHLLLYQAGGLTTILSKLSSTKLSLVSPKAYSLHASTIIVSLVWPIFPSFTLSFPFIQRLLLAKHQGQSTNMYWGGMAFLIPFVILLALIGLAAVVLYPQPSSEHVIIRSLASLPPGFEGLVGMAILGIILSTADSCLHAASIALVHDTLKPLASRWGIKLDELRVSRYSMVIIAALCLVICLSYQQLSGVYARSLELASLPLVFPLIFGIAGLKTDTSVFFISSVATISVFVFSVVVLQSTDVALIGSILANLFSYLGAHYYYHRGFEVINRSAYGQTTSVWHPSWQGTRTTLAGLIPTPQKVVRYFQQRVAENSANTTTLALFVACSYMVPLFMHSIGQPDAYNWLLSLRIVGALLCVGLMLQSQWPAALLRFFSTYYHLTLLWCFPFMTTFLFLLEGGSMEWVMNVMLSVTLFIMLLDYLTAVGLSIIGVVLAIGVYKLGIGPLALSMDRDTAYMLVYGVGFSVAVGTLFSRIRERLLRQSNRRLVNQEAALEAHLPKVVAEKEKYTRAFQQIGIKSLLHTARKLHTIQHLTTAAQEEQQALLTSLARQQQAPPTELVAQKQEALQEELTSLAQQQEDLQADLLPLVMQLQDLEARGQDHLTLDVKKDLPLDRFLLSLQEKLLPRGIDVPLITERKTQQTKLTADTDRLATLLVKGIAALQWLIQDQDQYLLLGLEDTHLAYPLPDVAEGYVKQVPALRITLTATEQLPPLSKHYRPALMSSAPETQPTFQTMEAQEDARLIKAHYGYSEVSEDTLVYVIPVDVYGVRPLDMDKPELALGALPVRADDHFKHETADAQAQEEAFLKEVGTKTNADLGMVKLALNLIKWYHGPKNRHSGEPFYLHPLAVAQIVLDYAQDEATIVGALLHDTVEDTPMLLTHIEVLFGKETAEVVDLVTHLQSIPGSMYKIKLSAEENLRMLSNSENRRGLYVKLADRMHNMRTINGHRKVAKRKLVAQETLDFFVPLARKLGLQEAAQEFKERCEAVFKMKG